MKNREVFFRDPVTSELLNNGVSKVAEIEQDSQLIKTLRFELETFVCDGEYARGMERILRSYLDGLSREEQKAAWVSGFFGSGKTHLVKMLRYLWVDYKFQDGATARSIVTLPAEISDLFTELTNRARPLGGLRAIGGTLGAGAMDNVRLAFMQLILRAMNLPESLAQARFLLWLSSSGLLDKVDESLKRKKRKLRNEVDNLYLSTSLAEALVEADPKYGTPANAQSALRADFPENTSPTIKETLFLIRQIFETDGKLPCILLVVDEIQQFIAEKIQRAMDVQEIAEACCTGLERRFLFVGTGQSSLSGKTPSLQRLRARFVVPVQLSDADVESVIRQTVLRKKPEKEASIRNDAIENNQGEIARHLQGTRLASTLDDEPSYVPDYPLLPTRRRFWERVLRNTDQSGTSAQLRTQIKIVFDAARASADRNLGTVVPADFIYDQISQDLLNTGQLEREYDEIIRKQRDGSSEGDLRSRLCALIFLIGKLPRTAGTDDGVRATSETLIDLLVADLAEDRAKLKQTVPGQLDNLVKSGQVMMIEDEYRLQTREGAKWTHDFSRRRTSVLNDEVRIATKRQELIRDAVHKALHPVSLAQGIAKQARKLDSVLSSVRPAESREGITLWMRDGWNDEEKVVLNEARAAGTGSPMLFGYLPWQHHEELRQAIATEIAGQETLDAYGVQSTAEGIEARQAVETRVQVSRSQIRSLLGHIVSDAKVFLGGGQEANGIELADKVEDAGEAALDRLFPKFSDADHSNWGQVVTRARAGDVGALAQVGYKGEITKHPVCRQVMDLIGAAKKGKDIRDYFKVAPFGWPQDSVDGALYALTVAGNLRVTLNGQPVQPKDLPQNQIGVATFYVDVPPLSVTERLDLKALFQKLGVNTKNGEESVAAAEFLKKLIDLGQNAGGEAPRPLAPDTKTIRELQMLSGNAQLLEIHHKKTDLESNITEWDKISKLLAKRLPLWGRLMEFDRFAGELPESSEWSDSIGAIAQNRLLLSDPDPLSPILQKMVNVLRGAVSKFQSDVKAAYEVGTSQLRNSDVWQKLGDEKEHDLTMTYQLITPNPEPFSTEEEILSALRKRSLSERKNFLDAVPQRFSQALQAAAKFLEPKAQHVQLTSATIRNEAELEAWLEKTRRLITEKLKDGPVIL